MSIIEHVQLNNGITMPLVGLGTWKSRPGQVENAVSTSIDCGYCHIDCAYVYGNEAEVGAALKKRFDHGLDRKEIFITSKLWNTRHHPDDVRDSILESLKLLGLDYLDLYLVHWPTAFKRGVNNFPRNDIGDMMYGETSLLETWMAMEKLVEEGLSKSIGVSNFNSEQVSEICAKGKIKPAVNQIEIHPYLSQYPLVNFCASKGVAVTAYSPLGSPDRPWAQPGEPSLLEDPQIINIAKRHKKSAAQVILRWLAQRNIIIIPKSVTPSRIEENFQIFDFSLSAEDMKEIDSFNRDARLIIPMVEKAGIKVPRDKDHPDFPFNIPF